MSRFPRLRPDELDAERRRLYDEITSGRRARDADADHGVPLIDDAGRLEGPFNAMLFQPAVGDALQRLGAALRYGGELPDRAREIAILVVAARWRCDFERRVHEVAGARAGLTPAELEALRSGAPVGFVDPVEAAVLAVTRTIVHIGDLDEASARLAADVLGPDGLFELTTLVGYYSLLAVQMRVFGVK